MRAIVLECLQVFHWVRWCYKWHVSRWGVLTALLIFMDVATCKHTRVSPLLVLLHGRLWNCAETLYSLSQGDLEYRWQVARLEWQSSDVSSAICAMWCNRVLDRSPMGHRDLDGWKHFTAFSIRLDHFGFCTFFKRNSAHWKGNCMQTCACKPNFPRKLAREATVVCKLACELGSAVCRFEMVWVQTCEGDCKCANEIIVRRVWNFVLCWTTF